MKDDIHSILKYNNEITMIYGEAATGKTTMAKLAAIKYAKDNKKVIYIDSENGFSIDRFRQLAGNDYINLLDNIIFFKPKNLKEQRKTFKDLIPIVESGKIGLVIIDTIGVYYRLELRDDNKYANKSLGESLKIFEWISKKGIPVILTNQVYSDLNNNLKGIGENILFNSCNNIIFLEKSPRKMVFKKQNNIGKRFEIKENGIDLLE